MRSEKMLALGPASPHRLIGLPRKPHDFRVAVAGRVDASWKEDDVPCSG